MFAQRQVLRALRTPAIQRRFASTAPKAGENAFVAERRAVKEHAAESTGMSKQNSEPSFQRDESLADAIGDVYSSVEEDLYLV